MLSHISHISISHTWFTLYVHPNIIGYIFPPYPYPLHPPPPRPPGNYTSGTTNITKLYAREAFDTDDGNDDLATLNTPFAIQLKQLQELFPQFDPAFSSVTPTDHSPDSSDSSTRGGGRTKWEYEGQWMVEDDSEEDRISKRKDVLAEKSANREMDELYEVLGVDDWKIGA